VASLLVIVSMHFYVISSPRKRSVGMLSAEGARPCLLMSLLLPLRSGEFAFIVDALPLTGDKPHSNTLPSPLRGANTSTPFDELSKATVFP
jgi:hypothetical protein